MILGMVSPALKADEAACQKVLGLCDSALKAHQANEGLQAMIIADQDKTIKEQESQIKGETIWKPLALGAGTVAIIESLILVFKK